MKQESPGGTPVSNPEQEPVLAAVPELLAPAGNWECARAAIECGADAIYFGLDTFNARMRADNFTRADLPELMGLLHERGVKGYLTLNTLVFENELESAAELLRAAIEAGVDAAIVQDIGICRLIRSLSPDFPIHGSTQMTITSASGIRVATELGCDLVVMARECSIAELKQIRRDWEAHGKGAAEPMVPLEVFVHGALCVAYSGQCLTSEALGGRSANRGECAQACRMTYDLFKDGEAVPLGDRRYLLSPQDLMGLEAIPDLIAAGVHSFKIEGRLKNPAYVANVTSAYRQAIDGALGDRSPSEPRDSGVQGSNSAVRYDLEMAFSRGLHSGWLHGIDNQQLVHARFGKKRGVYVGRVLRVEGNRVVVGLDANAALKVGDGVVFDQGRPDQREQGGRVFQLNPSGASDRCEISFRRDSLDTRKLREGDRVWKTSDPDYERRWQQAGKAETPIYRRPVYFTVVGQLGEPLTVKVDDGCGNLAEAQTERVLETARSRPLSESYLTEQLGRLGRTPFYLKSLECELGPDLIVPVSELNRARRRVIESLTQQRRSGEAWQVNEPQPIGTTSEGGAQTVSPTFVALVRSLEQLDAALAYGTEEIYCDFEEPKQYREAVARFRQRGEGQIFVAPPRIYKPGEDWILKQVASSEPDGVLARNYDHLRYFAGARFRADFSFNIANSLSADWLLGRTGMERVTASYDLNAYQLEALLRKCPGDAMEITLHQHMPMFHMEHCVFCAFLSKGKDYRDCGRPCDKYAVTLKDRVGQQHRLKADAGCRNTVFNGRAQTGAEYLDRFRAAGGCHFRIEFVDETAAQVEHTLASYQKLADGAMTGETLWQSLKVSNQLGVTRGTLSDEVPANRPEWASAQ